MPKAVKKKKEQLKDPKASHLYTDDNPQTTLHGTGFKDKATAVHTIELVSKRSLTYQFQTINTMLYRAKGHPHKTAGILEAIEMYKDWTETYKDRKAALRSFPLLKKDKVEKYLKQAEEYNEAHEGDDNVIDLDFALMYTSLPSKKRLANTLLHPEHPDRDDLEVKRYNELCILAPDPEREWTKTDLWQDTGKATLDHLRLLMYAYSPLNAKHL